MDERLTAFVGQTSTQLLQKIHLSSLNWGRRFPSAVTISMAFEGQFLLHKLHPMQRL